MGLYIKVKIEELNIESFTLQWSSHTRYDSEPRKDSTFQWNWSFLFQLVTPISINTEWALGAAGASGRYFRDNFHNWCRFVWTMEEQNMDKEK